MEQTRGAELAKLLLPEWSVENGSRSNYWSTLVAGFTSFPMSLFYLEIVRFEWGSGELRELGTKNGNTRIIQVLIPV